MAHWEVPLVGKGCSNKGERGKLYDCIHNNPPPDVLRLNRPIKSITGISLKGDFYVLRFVLVLPNSATNK